jgi:Bacterial Ig domain
MFNNLLNTSVLTILATTISAAAAFAGVTVSSPTPGATVGSPVHFVASATSANPVTSMTIYVDGATKYQIYSNHLDTSVALGAGSHSVVVQAWDSTGAVTKSPANITVSGSAAPSGVTGVTISSPANGSSNGSPVHFVASASAPKAIGAMRVYVDNNDVYDASSNHLDTSVSLGNGTHYVVIQAWDVSGALYKATETISVGGAAASTAPSSSSVPSGAKVFSNIDQTSGWENCDACAAIGANGPANPHSITQNVANPSMDGKSAQFWIGGSTPFSDALWWKQLGGNDGTAHFTYDLYFYVKDLTAQALEFDANQGFGAKRYIMGTQCALNGDKQWDVWNAATGHWVATGFSCMDVKPYTWNHLVEQFERVNGQTHFISITINGVTHYINKYSAPQPIPSNVHELNVAVQLDENSKAQGETMWVDKINLSAW